MIICRSCGSNNPDDGTFCTNCGSSLEGCERTTNVEQFEQPVAYPVPQYTTPNTNYQPYTQNPQAVGDDYKVVSLLALIFGIVAFFLNPLYSLSIAAIVLGIIAHVKSINFKTRGMAGWILGIISFVLQIIVDIFCTFGAGIFC